jgi:transposase
VEQLGLKINDKSTKFDRFGRDELIEKYESLEGEYFRALREIYRLKYQHLTEAQLNLVLEEHIAEMRQDQFGSSSERWKKPANKPKKEVPPKPRVKKPSERYPNITIRDIAIKMDPLPGCDVCGKQMSDSGMTEDSEQLTVIPKKFEILRTQRSIYRCSCQSCMKTAPVPERILPGSTYSDEMIMDVSLSKYCDLIPIERYVQMAARSGLMDLPPNSLIDLTHQFAFFVKPIYGLIKAEVMKSRVLQADETPHRMLEGSEKKTWHLWGFSTPEYCFLECHDTRSGDVASDVLLNSACEVLLTDVYSGYGKATRIVNQSRLLQSKIPLENAYCNAHARRYFFKPRIHYAEAEFYLQHYHEIYQLNSEAKGKPLDEVTKIREKMAPHFEAMKNQAMEELPRYPEGNKYRKALNYYLENYDGLTLFLTEPDVPIDNNAQERLLRSHVVGRKTWYGTHSEQGAETAAILFSIVETCTLNEVNPREYFPDLVASILARKESLTPVQWKTQKQLEQQ